MKLCTCVRISYVVEEGGGGRTHTLVYTRVCVNVRRCLHVRVYVHVYIISTLESMCRVFVNKRTGVYRRACESVWGPRCPGVGNTSPVEGGSPLPSPGPIPRVRLRTTVGGSVVEGRPQRRHAVPAAAPVHEVVLGPPETRHGPQGPPRTRPTQPPAVVPVGPQDVPRVRT